MISYIYQTLPEEDCYRIGEALKANNCLREFHLKEGMMMKMTIGNSYPGLPIIIEHLCRNETLNEVTIDLKSEDKYKGELQLCVSSIQYFTCLHLGREPYRESIPSPTECFPPGLSPSSTVLHTKHVFLTACTVHWCLWFIQPSSMVPLTPLQYY